MQLENKSGLVGNRNLLFLSSFYVLMLCLTVCFANNIIQTFDMTLPGGIFVFPLSFIVCDVVGEVYGYGIARTFIWIGIISELIFASASQLLILIPHPEFFQHGEAYTTVFSPTLRYVLSGIAGFFVGEFLNIYILSRWKVYWKGKLFVVRSVCTTAIGQLLLSIVVDYLAFYGKMATPHLWMMIFSGWKMKMIYSLLFVLPASMIVRYLKRTDKVDHFDTNTNYNPFKI